MPAYVPATTPWITAIDPETSKKYVFNLTTYRRGGAVLLRMHPNSPTMPGVERRINRSRSGYGAYIDAAMKLIHVCHRDPTAAAPYPKSMPDTRAWVWNTRHPDYVLRNDAAQIVALHLEPVLDPRRGRASIRLRVQAKEQALTGTRTAGITTVHKKARQNRKTEMLMMQQRMLALLIPHRDRVEAALKRNGGRGRTLTGYTHAEALEVKQHLFLIQTHLERFHDLLTYDQFGRAGTPIDYTQAKPAPERRYLPGGSFTYDPPRSLATAPDSPRSEPFVLDTSALDAPAPLPLDAFDLPKEPA